jgi:MoaA/NifB/PqqE/SkfB family radical SAM enzyme
MGLEESKRINEEGIVEGKTYTSNVSKLLKHLPKIKRLQDGMRPSPVMFHMSPANPCNMTCSFCCFANRTLKEMLTYEQMTKAIDSFVELGATGMELTGGGEPTLHPDFGKVVNYAYEKGLKIGVVTNGTMITKWHKVGGVWDKLEWIRLGMYGFYEGYTYDIEALRTYPNLTIGAAYIWDENFEHSDNPNVTGKWETKEGDKKGKKLAKNRQTPEHFERMLEWVEKEKIPTRIAFNSIKVSDIIKEDISLIKNRIKDRNLKYAFLSDFNWKGERRDSKCYMHNFKPFVFTDGNVYVCPCAEMSVENAYRVNSEFKICDIDGILDFYNSVQANNGVERTHACTYCKYAAQNELIGDAMTETQHNDFA